MTDDLISRQAVIDITWEEPSYTDALNVLTEVRDKVKSLPPVNPQEPKYCDRNICVSNEYNGISCDECEVTKSQEPKTGHWIKAKPWMLDYTSYKWECSECEKSERFRHNYCPNCGARMVEPQESEDKE